MSAYVEGLPPSILRDWMNLALGQRLGIGSGRQVFVYDLCPQMVIKVEDRGFQNVVEGEVWKATKGTRFEKWFAPVRQVSGMGTILIMDRTLPAPRSAYPRRMPEFLGDLKYSNFGLLGGRLVCHDYGSINNFLKGVVTNEKLRTAKWWDAGDGSSFDDGAKP
jgi:hypothetical protein